MDRCEFILAFPQNTDEKILKKAKADYQKIRKYLLRLTAKDNYYESEERKQFKVLTFAEFLEKVGMYEFDGDTNFERARERYITALRCEVKNSGLLLLKRGTGDIFTNNFNKYLIRIHQANQDIQFVTDEYAVAQYILNYLLKNESGVSALLKQIDAEATQDGEPILSTIKKIGKVLDKGREISIQEAIYRALGLPMTKFSDVVRFIDTSHPHRREGLLKSNLIEIDNGEKIFHNSYHDFYEIRPCDEDGSVYWTNLCLADFVAEYSIDYTKNQKNIQLLDGKSFIGRRRRQCVLRYFLKYESEEELCRALCILFLPFRNEMLELHSKDIISLYEYNKEEIEFNRNKYEKHKVIVDTIDIAEKEQHDDLDDIEEEELYVVEETTSVKDIADFEKQMKKDAKKMLSNYTSETYLMEEDDFMTMILQLNTQQRVIYDDVVERMYDQIEENPFYLYIGGNAGTGKSFLLRAMINAAKIRGKRSGADVDKPACLVLAPTGVAAYLINGTTIESGLGIQPSKDKSYAKSDPSKNSKLRFLYEDLLILFIDEISMVGSDMLVKMNFRLQDILGNNKFFGGVSVVCTGDFGQLPPVGQRMIWESSHLDNRLDICPNYWDEYFKIYFLTQKMRSQDEEYSSICDKVRQGICDNNVLQYMLNHVRNCPSEDVNDKYQSGQFCIIVTSNKSRNRINNEKLEKLLPSAESYIAVAVDKSTNNPQAPTIANNIPLTRTGQLPTMVQFKVGAPVMITSNSSNSKYKKNGIVNGARGYVDSIQLDISNRDSAEAIWIRFTDDKIGQLLRQDSRDLLNSHKPNHPLSVPIKKQKKQFQISGNTEYLRDQFPLTTSYCITSYKSQGCTLDEVKVDYSNEGRFRNGCFYTAISRVKLGETLYLKDFKPEYIKANPDIEKKMTAMKTFSPHSFWKTYLREKVFEVDHSELKLGYLNINDIMTSRSPEFINQDDNLLALDFLMISDTRLSKAVKGDHVMKLFDKWSIEGRFDCNVGKKKHMGMLLLRSKKSEKVNLVPLISEKCYLKNQTLQIQLVMVSFDEYALKSAFIYTRQTPTKEQLKDIVRDCSNVDLIMGDLNLDPKKKEDRAKLDLLCQTRSMILNETTTIRFNQLDHILLDNRKFSAYFATSYLNYTTDHHCLTIRIGVKENELDIAFLQKLLYTPEKVTKKVTHQKYKDKGNKRLNKESKEVVNPKKINLKQEEGIESENIVVTTPFNLSFVNTPNWLNDEVINNYLQLLNKENQNIFMFTTFFFTAFLRKGFNGVCNYYRKYDILSYRMIFIPVHHSNHWFLITFDGKYLISLDPYNYPESNGLKKKHLLEGNRKYHEHILMDLKDHYFKPLYSLYKKQWTDLQIKVQMPPDIPAQNNSFDCGVFLLMFAKYLVFRKEFDFTNDDMRRMRDEIRNELTATKINCNFGMRNARTKTKRRNPDEFHSSSHIKRLKIQSSTRNSQRRFLNHDNKVWFFNILLTFIGRL